MTTVSSDRDPCSLVQKHHDSVHQQTLIEKTEWKMTNVSELLQDMEQNRCRARIADGREKIVVLPEELPPDADAD